MKVRVLYSHNGINIPAESWHLRGLIASNEIRRREASERCRVYLRAPSGKLVRA